MVQRRLEDETEQSARRGRLPAQSHFVGSARCRLEMARGGGTRCVWLLRPISGARFQSISGSRPLHVTGGKRAAGWRAAKEFLRRPGRRVVAGSQSKSHFFAAAAEGAKDAKPENERRCFAWSDVVRRQVRGETQISGRDMVDESRRCVRFPVTKRPGAYHLRSFRWSRADFAGLRPLNETRCFRTLLVRPAFVPPTMPPPLAASAHE
ncbi:hypothetical protein PCL_08966 [Purpureocillium lilacinum]|uniref:Uncharacterized protein n=1 Tax=Purpureocillium lilacinum TaxID=33203 RepID=A0A2U3EGX5_PURLI|nr:hypothetical protein Purlil1_8275 [Purpureocillium lilacinum]PWI73690.1 hypothetical protein PCL_08966 [Purpureocillium lilacinum]